MIGSPSDSERAVTDSDLLLRLTSAVMAPGEHRGVPLDLVDGRKVARVQGHGGLVFLPIGDLLRSGAAFMVKVAQDLLVLDADTEVEVETLQHVARQLELDGHRFVLVASGTPGHMQLWARVGRDYRAEVEQRLQSLDPDARPDCRMGRMVRPPGTPHPGGRPVALVEVGLAEALSILSASRSLADRLGPTARTALETGRSGGTDESRSAAQWSVLRGCVAARFTDGEVVELFEQRHAGTQRYREQAQGNATAARRHLLKDVARALDRHRASPVVDDPHSARVALAEVALQVDGHQWGQQRITDLAVVRAHLTVAGRQGRVSGYSASLRELALAAGVAPTTVSRAHDRLVRDGWLICDQIATRDQAARWSFAPARRHATARQQEQGGVTSCCATARTDWSADVWRPAGLGHAAGYVWDALDPLAPVTPAELADRLDYRSAGTVRRHLARLEAVGLAQRTPHGWIRGAASEVEAAETAGATGESEWYAASYRRDRQRWTRRRAQMAAEDRPIVETVVDPDTGEICQRLRLVVREARQDRSRKRPWPIAQAA